MIFIKKPSLKALSCASILFALSGCVPPNQFGEDYSRDVCKTKRDELIALDNHFSSNMVAGGIIGTLAGAGLGAAAAAATNGDIITATLIGAAAGMAVGAGSAYWNELSKQHGEGELLLFSLLGDMRRDEEKVTKAQIALDNLMSCRRTEAAQVHADYRAKRISAQEAKTRMEAIRRRAEKDVSVAKDINKGVQDRRGSYEYAFEQSKKIKTKNKKDKKKIEKTYTSMDKYCGSYNTSVQVAETSLNTEFKADGFTSSYLIYPDSTPNTQISCR
ncbi:hypothetical protein [Rhodospirillum rubrum]|uniref:Glycine zipper domain-containing protein n=1 Tax=Rhodospirillum rubrum (strain ATCC 11170 / ATH 1.1.1 / DSM 467 / LMG 4362 / NCIMB 8255 / S1) TaxID=269796 RepID=Q2RW25_RHORT|nr:hypothetical protein [Rhodospirillum rubrum]ABC21670.1 hypothetical protein Rru_A0869 [Rhodospirillum rubrum ATCC 11170]AEO47368.1 hypothetical protein F11_04490 [Rhodospirillum rubrum F11]MBK5953222.1 hypothetical protein [Rhodospirillum rubrum]QXG81335.1 hypothetical protein KUL73_04540 [Rhodospirillum rubrum]